jgi:protein-S-isoprenylcysteine O-methyltransferase Ste14
MGTILPLPGPWSHRVVAVAGSRCHAGDVTSDTPAPGWLVPLQGLAMAGHALPGGPRLDVPAPVRALGWAAVVGGAVLAAGAARTLGTDLTPSVTPREGAALRTEGLYAVSRHPLYAGLLLASGGAVLARGRLTTAVASAALAVVLHVKAGAEDRVLADRYGQAWRTYAARVPRLLPHPGAVSSAR